MKPLPTIGFDRYVPKHWLDTALAVAAGKMERSAVVVLLATEIAGVEARGKTMIILNRMWLTPHPTLVALAQAGIELHRADNAADTLPLHWGMALASHPLFAGIADNIGRLLKLHGEFTALQINRRLKEQLGDRASILRATEAVLQSLMEWQVIREAADRKRCFVAGSHPAKTGPALSLWIVESCLRASGKSFTLNEASNLAFPFKLSPLREADIVHHSRLNVTITGNDHASVSLRPRP
ncbi:MAG: hypothetical protein Q8M01_07045 [Rubrivivax sp.]|nr:hypothetical protein [Rubrivivax sp.]